MTRPRTCTRIHGRRHVTPLPLSTSPVYSRLPIRPRKQTSLEQRHEQPAQTKRTPSHGPSGSPSPELGARHPETMLLLLAILWILCDAGGGQQHQQQQQQQRARFTPVHRFPPPPIVPVPGGGVKISPELINQALQLPPNYQGQGSGFAPQRMTQLTISQGALRGRMSSTPSGKGMVAFMGVPYAAAPIGPLRFKVRGPSKKHRECSFNRTEKADELRFEIF